MQPFIDVDEIIKVVSIVLCVVFVVFLGTMFIIEETSDGDDSNHYQELESMAHPHEMEIVRLKKELVNLQKDVSHTPVESRFLMGFALSAEEDIEYIREKEQTYGISPILLWDCNGELSLLQTCLHEAALDWEIMLYTNSLSNDDRENIQAVQRYLTSIGREDTGIFFVRAESISAASLEAMREEGFIGYTLYHDSPIAGQTKNGEVYFDYAYIQSNEVNIDTRLSAAHTNHAAMLYVFDMDKIRTGELSATKVDSIFGKIQTYAGSETGSFATVGQVVTELSAIDEILAQKQQEYDLYVLDIQKRIEELEETIRDIYADWEGEK